MEIGDLKFEIGNWKFEMGDGAVFDRRQKSGDNFEFRISNFYKSSAFTMIEVLAVAGIIAVLAAIILPVLGRARQYSWRARARADVHQIAVAWKSYLNDYRQFPNTAITKMDVATLNILATKNTQYNSENIYMDSTTNELVVGFRDLWGELYQVALDNGLAPHDTTAAYDGQVVAPGHGALYKNVAVWSKGKQNGLDGTSDDPSDDVISW